MNNLSKTKIFLLVFLAVFLVLSLWQIRGGDFYTGRVKLLVLGRGEGEKRNIEQVVENIVNFPFGRENIKITRLGESGILEISLVNQAEDRALLNLEKEIRFIFSTLSRYYDVKDEINISLVGKREVKNAFWEKIENAWEWRVVLSLIISILLTAVAGKINKIRLERERYFSKRQAEIRKNIPTPWEIKEEMKREKESEISENIDSPLIRTAKSAVAPSNLPVAGDEIERLFGATKNGSGYKFPENSPLKKEAVSAVPEEKPALYREATPEEVKERLNKLLGNA